MKEEEQKKPKGRPKKMIEGFKNLYKTFVQPDLP